MIITIKLVNIYIISYSYLFCIDGKKILRSILLPNLKYINTVLLTIVTIGSVFLQEYFQWLVLAYD